jgi:hypothetical protein
MEFFDMTHLPPRVIRCANIGFQKRPIFDAAFSGAPPLAAA